MFDVSRSEVRKSVEQATWMPPELQNFALEKVMLKCLKFLSSGMFFTCTVLTFKCIVSVRVCQFIICQHLVWHRRVFQSLRRCCLCCNKFRDGLVSWVLALSQFCISVVFASLWHLTDIIPAFPT